MLKKALILSLVIIVFSTNTQAQVAINTDGSAPDTSAMLDVKSTDMGILIPRMDDTAMNNIATPATGLMVYNTTANDFYYYDGSNWTPIGNATIDNDWTVNGNDMYSSVSGNVGVGENAPAFKLDVNGDIRHGDALYIHSNTSSGSHSWVKFNSPDNGWGDNIFIGAGGTTLIGAGESSSYVRDSIDTSNGHETLYLTSDGDVRIITRLQDGWDNRVEALEIKRNRDWNIDFKRIYMHDTLRGTNKIRFITRTDYHYGYGVSISPGQGLAIGGGESANTLSSNISLENTEILYLSSDNQGDREAIKFITNTQDNWSDRVEAMTIFGKGKVTLDNVLRLKPSAEPASPEEGDIYMDSTTHKLRAYDGSTWHDLW
jgi:roadblock/LC7 domain-containing protein